jgi:hypothetical protein
MAFGHQGAVYIPTNNTKRSAGARLDGGLWISNRRMPETMGLTKYISKIENMYTK